ncbi:MAG: hypothetical protein CL398_09745 [Acidiferrobacteraceae bacterium]|nr:hypothetical protein [Acidiferrobacteraceae bacterium]|tara:strand:+ start:3978 stop:5228 length:1251 start_codon:yes stop_codon:yes gene_type:complete
MSNQYYAYRIVAAGSVMQMMYLGCVFTFSVFFPGFEIEFGWTRASIAGAASLNFLMLGMCGILMGAATDRYGPRIVLSFSGALFAIGFVLMCRMSSLWELYLYYGIIAGIGMAAHDIATLSTVTRWFIHHRGLASGIVKAGAGIGQVLVPPLAVLLVSNFSWRVSCAVIGTMTFLIIIIAAQLMKRDPESMGLQPIGSYASSSQTNLNNEEGITLQKALRTRQFWVLCLAKLADMFCLFTIVLHIVPHAMDQGLSQGAAAAVLSTIGASSIIGRISLGIVFDRLDTAGSLLICFSLLTAGLLILQSASDPSLLFLFAPIYGIGHGGFFAIAAPSIGQYFGTKFLGVILGVMIFIGTLGGTLGPWMTGLIFDLSASYDLAFLILTGFAVFGILLSLSLRVLGPIKNQLARQNHLSAL